MDTGTRQNRLLGVTFEQFVAYATSMKDIQISGWATAHAGLAFACKTNARAGFDARGDVHRQRTVFFDAALRHHKILQGS